MNSIGQAIGDAYDWTKHVLFRPFDLGKWFVIGFSAWLAGLGERGGSNYSQQGDFSEFGNWAEDNLPIVIGVGVVLFLLFVGFMALFTWLSSRGKLMFIDNVATNTAAVKEPWNRFRDKANNLFKVRFLIWTAVILLFAAGAVVFIALAWQDLRSKQFGPGAIAGTAVMGGLAVTVGLAYAVFVSVLEDFVIPILYLRDVTTLEALGIFRHEVLPGRFGAIVLFYLMKIVLVLGVVMFTCVATCITCCMTAVPYLGTVLLLPLLVFMRSYSLFFLEQCGPEYSVFYAAQKGLADLFGDQGAAGDPGADFQEGGDWREAPPEDPGWPQGGEPEWPGADQAPRDQGW